MRVPALPFFSQSPRATLFPSRNFSRPIPDPTRTKAIGRLGQLCGVALLVLAAHAAGSAQTYGLLFSFDGANGAFPWSSVIQGADGNLYGTTTGSGYSSGTVYKITPSGTLTTIYEFCSLANCADGSYPEALLVLGTDGNFYGTTSAGGSTAQCGSGCGTIFKLTPQGVLTTLHDFCVVSGCPDGSDANTALVQGTNGNFYGVALHGGANDYGTLFEVTSGGTFTTLYSFCAETNCTDGSFPNAPLVLGSNGTLYGTTGYGGANGYGEVFKVSSTGVPTVLHSFDGTDGEDNYSALVQANNGYLYGMTQFGGTNTCFVYGCGTLYKMTASGTLTTLVDFDGTNGANPVGGLVQGSDGNFYGVTGDGGANEGGTIFKLTAASGTLSTLYTFSCSGCSAYYPTGLFQATNGIFYGTAGGGEGIVFSLSAGLRRFVDTLPTSGKVGTKVKILGNSFTGATAVSFNGTAATFTVASATEITTTVPTGATTGKVSVTLSTGTVVSTNASFRVP
jgi:uncharacterized repeat protein (TIGR03803 family)